MKPLTLRRNFSWTFIGNIIYAACQWGMLVVIAKLGSPEMVGQFTLGLAITAPVILFFNLQLRAIQATDARQEYLFGDYLGLRLLTTIAAILFIGSITLISNYQGETALVVITFGLVKAVESISDVFNGLVQQHERMDRLAIAAMFKGILSLVLLTLGIYFTHSVLWGTIGLLIAWIIVLVTYDIRSGVLMLYDSQKIQAQKLNLALLKPRWEPERLRKLVWLSLPLGFVMMLISLNANIPRYFIERYLGERELGFFAAISYLMVATATVVNALGQSASPRLAKYYAEGNRKEFRNLLLKLVGIGIGLGTIGIVVVLLGGREILTIVYRPEYAEYLDIFLLIMITTAVSDTASFLGYGMTAARYFSIQMPLSIIVTGTSALTCFWLIPSRGLTGAAIALLIGAILNAILSLSVNLYALQKLPQNSKKYET